MGATHEHEHRPGWAEHASGRLAEAGYRRGGARAAVIELLGSQRCAMSAYDIEDALRDEGARGVARASIYRILDELESLKLVQRIDVGQGVTRYEALDPSGDHHHHMVCDRCGDVIPFHDAELERTMRRVAGRVTFDVSEHEIVLHGACADCAE
jgi:Fur family ferric uptake transcriptional regulator